MTVGDWALANPNGLWWALLVIPIILVHVLRPRRLQATVGATYLWRSVASPVSAAKPWQRLILSWLLAAQLLAALLLALAMARPVHLTGEILAEHTVFIIDASASMQATDGTPDRLSVAVNRAAELRAQVPQGGQASLIVAGADSRALLTRSQDTTEFEEALESIRAGDGAADFAGAFALAAGLDTIETESRVVLISDGGVPDAQLRAAPLGSIYEAVGLSATNRGITQFLVESSTEGLTARVTVSHFGGPPVTQSLRIDVDGVTHTTREVSLEAGEVVNLTVPVPPGDRFEAFLEGGDALAIDDRAVATVARRPAVQVLWAGPDNAFIEAALAASPGIEVSRAEKVPVAEEIGPDIDVVVVDRVPVPADLDIPTLAIAPPGGAGGLGVSGVVAEPIVTLVRGDDPLIQNLDFSEIVVIEAQRISVDDQAQVILGAENAPLLIRSRLEPADSESEVGAPLIYVGFALNQSTLPLQISYPLLIDRVMAELSDLITPPSRLTVGSPLPLDPRMAATVTSPSGTSQTVPAGSARPTATQIGFWVIETDGGNEKVIAVVPDRAESAIAPVPGLALADRAESTPGELATRDKAQRGQRSLIRWLALAILVVLLLEYLLARRRRGVSPTQWRYAAGLRAGVGLAVIAAALGLVIDRPANDVATSFLIDASDSMTAAGRAEATAVIREALDSQPDDTRAGVVVFGNDARLETLISNDPQFSGISVTVDPAGTDLAAAMRLGVAALPQDSARRLVVISDGRATSGDAEAEAARLATEGVPVDVVVINPASGSDLAVAALDVPSGASEGERIEISAEVVAPRPVAADVVLFRDGEEVDRVSQELSGGSNTVVFSDRATSTGLVRYQVEVVGAQDRVGDNNVGYGAVPVEGPERVLVLAGHDKSGASGLAAQLRAGGLEVEETTPGALPAIDELAGYSAVVLVDVDRFDLSEAQVTDLSVIVRDLGRGMVVIGGVQSYALGGYRSSDLEAIMPVVSEITDPLRRQTVAQVLAIDTSGSMGACHCREDGSNGGGLGGANSLAGGVEKTSIAATSAARAIAALGATDEVGVLSMDADDRWLIELQAAPPQAVVDDGLAELVPNGPTFLDSGLTTAAAELRKSEAALKHIILFSDGFTGPGSLADLADQAAELEAEGITVSVVSTGEGAAQDLQPIAEAGGGRFYPGRNLSQIPDLIVTEAVLASRNFVTEGDFPPLVASRRGPVARLTEAPNLAGYIATSAKATASVDLRIGPDQDPLLASWQAGLGRVSAWTSDSGERWAASWARWSEGPDFWASVVKDTFPVGGGEAAVSARIGDGQAEIVVESIDEWSDDATAVVRMAGPDGSSIEITLERIDGSTFAAVVPVEGAGTYAFGAAVTDGSQAAWTGVGLATRSYPAEYEPHPVDADRLHSIAATTGGRVAPLADEFFSPDGTRPGTRRFDPGRWLLLFAVLAWPLAVVLSRLAWRKGVVATGAEAATTTLDLLRARLPKMAEPPVPARADSAEQQNRAAQSPSVGSGAPHQPTVISGPPSIEDAVKVDEPPVAAKPDSAPDDPNTSTLSSLLDRKRSRGRDQQ